jgi:hypothetical protein
VWVVASESDALLERRSDRSRGRFRVDAMGRDVDGAGAVRALGAKSSVVDEGQEPLYAGWGEESQDWRTKDVKRAVVEWGQGKKGIGRGEEGRREHGQKTIVRRTLCSPLPNFCAAKRRGRHRMSLGKN